MYVYQVLPALPFDKTFSYCSLQEIALNTIVEIPFRNKKVFGLVESNAGSLRETDNLKHINHVFKNIIIPKEQLQFLNKVAEYNIIPRGTVLKMFLSSKDAILKEYNPLVLHNVTNSEALAQLNEEQTKAFNEIKCTLEHGFSAFVLDGITGSGKTEVYLNLIYEVIKSGEQALVLLPEIVLTSQLVSRFAQRFNFMPLEWHSNLTPKQRRIGWQAVHSGDARFIVGARSALFLPFKNLKLIIVDEEHDQSFKQEEGATYNARDMSVLLASIKKIPIILSSATPSIETIYNTKTGKYKHITLTSRYGIATMPKVSLINMETTISNPGTKVSETLRSEMIANFKKGKQSLIFLNRRGYAPITMCKECHHKLICPNCNFYLVEHKSKKTLQCHYCGYQEKHSTKCPNCGSHEKLSSIGAGVEKIEEEIKSFLPEARTILLTSDTIGNREAIGSILDAINNHQIDIIIGTQMLTKGLHFSNLELVGVIDADEGIRGGDIRALERTYQLLSQVSGRAGRESIAGQVFIQSSNPENIVMHNLATGNITAFIESEIEDRKHANMPPFSRVVTITVSSKNEEQNLSYVNNLSRNIPLIEGVDFLGPSPAPIFLLNRHYRHRFVIISQKNIDIQKAIRQWLASVEKPSSLKLKIDVDPYSFL